MRASECFGTWPLFINTIESWVTFEAELQQGARVRVPGDVRESRGQAWRQISGKAWTRLGMGCGLGNLAMGWSPSSLQSSDMEEPPKAFRCISLKYSEPCFLDFITRRWCRPPLLPTSPALWDSAVLSVLHCTAAVCQLSSHWPAAWASISFLPLFSPVALLNWAIQGHFHALLALLPHAPFPLPLPSIPWDSFCLHVICTYMTLMHLFKLQDPQMRKIYNYCLSEIEFICLMWPTPVASPSLCCSPCGWVDYHCVPKPHYCDLSLCWLTPGLVP